jgi:cardiolipin synthase A/B
MRLRSFAVGALATALSCPVSWGATSGKTRPAAAVRFTPVKAPARGTRSRTRVAKTLKAIAQRKPEVVPRSFGGADTAMVPLVLASSSRVYVSMSQKPSPELLKAFKDAAVRGVDVRAVLQASRFDVTWRLQQDLESHGIDVDVHSEDPGLDGWVADGTVVDASGKAQKDSAKASAMARRFQRVLTRTKRVAPAFLPAESVVVHPMPESTRTPILKVLGAATKSIDLEIYQLQDLPVVDALMDAAKRGVKVRVMLEPKTVGGRNYQAMVDKLTAAGIEVQPTPPDFDSSGNVDHAKICIVDGRELLFGTGNLVRSGLGGDTAGPYNNRDFWIQDSRAQSIAEAQALFDADWARKPTSGIRFTNLVVTPDNANAKIIQLIDAATKRLYVYNQELNDPAVIDKLIAAAQKPGMDVQVLLGYQPIPGAAPPNAAAIAKLTQAGIKATYLKKHYLHAKGIVSDSTAYLGSWNFTSGGLRKNREVGAVLRDKVAVQTVIDTFQSDAANPNG